jgi:Spy/CpxP family protein refolding chaperone
MMMRFFGKAVLTVGALALMVSPALAQGRGGAGGGAGGGGGAAGFLMAPNVQKDLKLTDEQVKKVQETLRETREKYQGDYAALRDASPDVRSAKMATLNESVNNDVKKALSFSAEQSKRFDQICLQAHELQAFANPTIQEKLKVTSDQKSKIGEIVEAAHNSVAGAFNKDASEQERTDARNKRAAAQKENIAKVHALLTDDQMKAWKELTGEPIEIQYPARRSNN